MRKIGFLVFLLFSIATYGQQISIRLKPVKNKLVKEADGAYASKVLPYVVVGVEEGGPVIYDISTFNKLSGNLNLGFIKTREHGYVFATDNNEKEHTQDLYLTEIDTKAHIIGTPQKIVSGPYYPAKVYVEMAQVIDNDARGFFMSDDKTKMAYVYSDGALESKEISKPTIAVMDENAKKVWSREVTLGVADVTNTIKRVVVTKTAEVVLCTRVKKEKFDKKTETTFTNTLYIANASKTVEVDLNFQSGINPYDYDVIDLDDDNLLVAGVYTQGEMLYNYTYEYMCSGMFFFKIDRHTGKIVAKKIGPLDNSLMEQLGKFEKPDKTKAGLLYSFNNLSLEKSVVGEIMLTGTVWGMGVYCPISADFSVNKPVVLERRYSKRQMNLGDAVSVIYQKQKDAKEYFIDFIDFAGRKQSTKELNVEGNVSFERLQWLSAKEYSFQTTTYPPKGEAVNSFGVISFK